MQKNNANVPIISINKMSEINEQICKLDPTKTIIFFDIDNTLLRTVTDIGSDEWIKWQERLFCSDSDNLQKYRATKSLPELYTAYRHWLKTSNCDVELMEEYIADMVNLYIDIGYKICLITARDKDVLDITFKQLSKYYDIKKFFSQNIFFETGVITYKSGIYFSAGTNKGLCIKKLLTIYETVLNYIPENIVFIDDSHNACCATMNSFKLDDPNNSNIIFNLLIFHYLNATKFQEIFNQIDKDVLHQKWHDFINKNKLNEN